IGYAGIEGAVGWWRYAESHNQLNRDLWLVTGVGSVVFLGELLIFPMVPAYASRRLARLPRSTTAERLRPLEKGERLLRRSAEIEAGGTNALAHILGAMWAVGTSSYLMARNLHDNESLGSQHNRAVLQATAIELVWTVGITELAIFTQPRRAISNYAA